MWSISVETAMWLFYVKEWMLYFQKHVPTWRHIQQYKWWQFDEINLPIKPKMTKEELVLFLPFGKRRAKWMLLYILAICKIHIFLESSFINASLQFLGEGRATEGRGDEEEEGRASRCRDIESCRARVKYPHTLAPLSRARGRWKSSRCVHGRMGEEGYLGTPFPCTHRTFEHLRNWRHQILLRCGVSRGWTRRYCLKMPGSSSPTLYSVTAPVSPTLKPKGLFSG